MAVFVELNGYGLKAPEEEVVQVMLAVADRRCTETELAEWVRAHVGITTRENLLSAGSRRKWTPEEVNPLTVSRGGDVVENTLDPFRSSGSPHRAV